MKPPSVSLVLTQHFHTRSQERFVNRNVVPLTGTHVRFMEMQDTLYHKKVWVLKIRNGAILAQWAGKERLMLLTVLTTEILARLQHRQVSRFMPIDSKCIQVGRIFQNSNDCDHLPKN